MKSRHILHREIIYLFGIDDTFCKVRPLFIGSGEALGYVGERHRHD